MSINKKRICVACNEDGFGPSAFAFYLVKAIVELWKQQKEQRACGFDILVLIFNNAAYDFNCSIYSHFAQVVQPIRLIRDSLIRLEKRHGEVDVPATLRILMDYDRIRGEFLQEIRPYLWGADIAIDVGVPLFVRSAEKLGVPHRLTLFDHSWAKTVRLTCDKNWEHLYQNNPKPTALDRRVADAIAESIEEDEQLASEVHLFGPYITPPRVCRLLVKRQLEAKDPERCARWSMG